MFNKERYLLAFMLSFSFLATMNVEAQEEDADVEEVVTTGSRIKSNDFELNSPVASLGADQINVTNTINIESLLNQLPQIVPGSDRSSNNPGSGTATVNLRGLGSTRTLVLLNGKRMAVSYTHLTLPTNREV